MNPITRRALLLAAPAGAFLAPAGRALAQTYPDANIRVICAFPPGAGLDQMVRFYANKLQPICGRSVLVENRPGAGGAIATEAVARSKPDGYTIFIHAGNALAANHHLMKNNPVDAREKILVAATISKQSFMLAVSANTPWKTLPELTAHLKQKGDKATFATGSIGAGVGDVMGALYNQKMGLQAVPVNYKTADASLNDLAAGQVDFGCYDPVFAVAQQREGRLRILAVASNDRRSSVPNVPTMSELGIPMDLLGWIAVMAPAGTDAKIVAQLNTWTNQILADPETTKYLAAFGGDVWTSTPQEGQARLNQDIQAWADFVRIAKLTPQ